MTRQYFTSDDDALLSVLAQGYFHSILIRKIRKRKLFYLILIVKKNFQKYVPLENLMIKPKFGQMEFVDQKWQLELFSS